MDWSSYVFWKALPVLPNSCLGSDVIASRDPALLSPHEYGPPLPFMGAWAWMWEH